MKFLSQNKSVFNGTLWLKACRIMRTVISPSLGLVIFFAYTPVYGLIYKTQVWQHKDDGHVVATLGDAHEEDCRSAEQQYAILKMVASIKNSRLICEDPVDGLADYWLHPDAKRLNLVGMHSWARLAGCRSTNVEFRLPRFLERAPSYAQRVLDTVEEIKGFDDEYNPVYKESLAEFEMYGRPLIMELQQNKFALKAPLDAQRRIMDAHGLPADERRFLDASGEDSLLDIKILHQIAESRKKNEIAIISAGGWHTGRIGSTLSGCGYSCLTEAENPLVLASLSDGTIEAKDQACKGMYKTFFDPVSIRDVHQVVKKHAVKNHTSLLRTQAVLSYLQLRGKVEASHFGYACYRARPIFRTTMAIIATATVMASGLFEGLIAVLKASL